MSSKVLIQEKVNLHYPVEFKVFGMYPFKIIYGEYQALKDFIDKNSKYIFNYEFEIEALNPKFKYPSINSYEARIEKGAIIRDNVSIAPDAIILMGSVINYGATIGSKTMIDMNAVIGSGAIIKDNVHIGAGVVISGVMEPISLEPVIVEDNVFIGANAVVKEGVIIRKGTIIGASSFVNKNTEEGYLYYGVPARKIRKATKQDYYKVAQNKELRK